MAAAPKPMSPATPAHCCFSPEAAPVNDAAGGTAALEELGAELLLGAAEAEAGALLVADGAAEALPDGTEML